MENWEWIESNLMPTLICFDNEPEITDFVKCKIESLLAHSIPDPEECIDAGDTQNFRAMVAKFIKIFNMPEEEKLVNCKYVHQLYSNL